MENFFWKPAVTGRVKINYDGSVFSEKGEAGLGVIIRNHQKEVTASLSQRIPFPHPIEALEALTTRAIFQLPIDLGFLEMDVEGDLTTIVQALTLIEPSYTLYDHIINDTKIASQHFLSVQFMHVKRDGNKVAHSLAKRARNSKLFQVWMESIPPDIV